MKEGGRHLAVCFKNVQSFWSLSFFFEVLIPLGLDRIVKLRILILNILNARDRPLVVVGQAAHDGWFARD